MKQWSLDEPVGLGQTCMDLVNTDQVNIYISNVPYIHGYIKQWSLDEPVGLGQTVHIYPMFLISMGT